MGKYSNVLSSRITGNVGAMNFRMKDGEIVAAQRSYTNKSKGDGASYSQREHRARLANVVDFFKAIALIEKRGWENKKPNQSDFNCFTAVNLSASPIFLTKQEAELGAAVAAPYAASRGSLSVIPAFYAGISSTAFVLGLNMGEDAVDWETETIGMFSTRIINNNPGWQAGDKLSICAIDQLQRVVAGVTIPQVEVTYLEISLDPESTTLIDTMSNWDAMQLDVTNDHVLQILDGADAAFAIHSRESKGYLETSSQDVIVKNVVSPIYIKYTSAQQKQDAMDSYGYQEQALLDPNSENVEAVSPSVTISEVTLQVGTAYLPVRNGGEYEVGDVATLTIRGAGFIADENPKVQLDWTGQGGWQDAEPTYQQADRCVVQFEDIEEPVPVRIIANGEVLMSFIVK